jgi:hypothetical protein
MYKNRTQFLNFLPPPFFTALEVFKEKSKKMKLKTRKEDKNLCFLTDFELFYHFRKLIKSSFQKINRLIVLFNRFFVNFHRRPLKTRKEFFYVKNTSDRRPTKGRFMPLFETLS